jgi:hypothetical protein
MINIDTLKSDLRQIVLEGPETITWLGPAYVFPAVFTDFTKVDRNEIGGFALEYDAAVHAQSELFPGSRPNVGDMFLITGRTFLIEHIENDFPDDVEIQFYLKARG